MKRRVDIPLYFAAFIITAIIFGIGFWAGNVYDSFISQNIDQKLAETSSQALSLQLFFLMDNDKEFCSFYTSELDKIDANTERLGNELTYLEETKNYANPSLKDKYFVLEAMSYVMSGKIKQVCNRNYSLVLYFYSNKFCGDACVEQGRELLKVKESLGEKARIYSFDCTLDSPVANSLCSKYGIKNYPAVIIGRQQFNGLHKSNELLVYVNNDIGQ